MLALFALSAFAAPVQLSVQIPAARAEVEALTAETCAPVLERWFGALEALEPAHVDLIDATAHADALIDEVFETRLVLQERLAALHAGAALDEDCLRAARRADLASRYLLDHLVEALAPERDWLVAEPGAPLHSIQAGDLLVTRGLALSSAGIAHMGDVDSQFSHNALVHRAADGSLWTVEAYLERGAVVQPLTDFLASGLGRVVVLRHEDPERAALGAALAYERVLSGPAIAYDAAFDDADPSTLFCSEVPVWALGELTGAGAFRPLSRTRFRDSELVRALGIEADGTSAPADLLVDPRFRIVAEWRDVAQLETMRRQDATVEAVFRWLEEDGYTLEPLPSDRRVVGFGLAVRRTPGIGGLLADRLHPEADPGFLVGALALDHAADEVYEALVASLGDRAGAPIPALRAPIESLRQRDLLAWQQHPRSASFHRRLHPKG